MTPWHFHYAHKAWLLISLVHHPRIVAFKLSTHISFREKWKGGEMWFSMYGKFANKSEYLRESGKIKRERERRGDCASAAFLSPPTHVPAAPYKNFPSSFSVCSFLRVEQNEFSPTLFNFSQLWEDAKKICLMTISGVWGNRKKELNKVQFIEKRVRKLFNKKVECSKSFTIDYQLKA